MTRQRVVIYGAGELGRQVLHHVRAYQADVSEVVGFIDDTRDPGEPVTEGLLTLGGLEAARSTAASAPADAHLLFAVGYGDMRRRGVALERALAAGYALHSVIHPRASIEPGVELGPGCVVLAGTVLDQRVRVGRACYLDVGVRLTNATVIGDNNYLATGVATGSRVRIGSHCFIGMDCTITTDVTIGDHVFVNAKTLVPRDVPSDVRLVEVHKSREIPQPPATGAA